MFKKILIANRGEIAIRVLRTCREMGIEAVVVYSTADRDSLHVQMATESYCIGGPKTQDSYLNVAAILTVAIETGCDAIHPGYGLLSERADFAELVEKAGLVFIGPSAETIRKLGDKATARRLMIEAGVPVTPGSNGLLDSAEAAAEIAAKVGYPILLKATAGGGGRGMRRVDREDQLETLFAEAAKEAYNAFGDGGLYLEKLILNPKHIEFQILADHEGNVIHLGERDCSLQRKRQKMIEESPCVRLAPDVRSKMGMMALRAARAADYRGAGTVEFIVDHANRFYFIEVNTRIQVEHPVTEMVSGIDLIREQIRIASGARLNHTQEQIELRGHAIECRINAEDPHHNFRPSPGLIERFVMPGGYAVRIDSAVYPGCEITPWYDSMIAKIIVRGDNRREAIRRMRRCLEELIVEGVSTNAGLLYVLLFEQSVIRGDYDTHYVEDHLESLLDYADLMQISDRTVDSGASAEAGAES